MPTVSRAQQRLMQAVAHGAKPKGGHGPSRAVAKDFVAADHARIAHAVISGKPKHKV
jgi:hypothetical protein